MLRNWPLLAAGLVLALQAGCGQELGGDSRRNAGGNIAGVGLGSDLGSVPPASPTPLPPGAGSGAAPQPSSAVAPAGTGSSPPPPGSAPPPPGAAPPAPGAAPTPGAPPPPGATTPATAETPQPETVRETAAVGATGKGDYGGPGVVTTPVSVYFQARERIVFEIAIPQAISLYEATNGFKPKTQESFMKDIIEFNRIQLPELPAGHKYIYDPKTGELMIERPA